MATNQVGDGKLSLDDAYGRVKAEEVWLMGCEIAEYVEANRFNHEPKRPRKLLLHASEVAKLTEEVRSGGATVIPLKIYFKHGLAKCLLTVGKGKKQHDKRHDLKERDAKREISRALSRRR